MIATRHKQLGRGTGFGVAEVGDPQFTISAGHEHAVAYTLKIRSGCEDGGKGALVQEDKVYPIHDKATRYKGGGPTRNGDGSGNGLGVGEVGAPMNTLTSADRHAVCYAFDKEVYNSGINASGGHYIAEGGPAPSLRATGHPPGVADCYIVRRLTPTECARLQGFPDKWGDIDEKATFTPEEFEFWQEVRNTHAAMNGKKVQEYTEQQMLSWYNKLHTDSAEFRMWGNGIAMPPALYVMQGIKEAEG